MAPWEATTASRDAWPGGWRIQRDAPRNHGRIARNAPVTAQIWKTGRVSSQGRRRNPPPGSGRSGHRRVPRPSPLPAPPPNALFAEMLRAARELLAVRSPLDAELMVSERSEEHTSELQSRRDLVCRLLLEKKKRKTNKKNTKDRTKNTTIDMHCTIYYN